MQEIKEEVKPENILPPKICLNKRELILPEEIHVLEIQQSLEAHLKTKPPTPMEKPIGYETSENPIRILWCPDELNFHLDDKPVTRTLLISNSSPKIILIRCTVLWTINDDAESAAKWYLCPKTITTLAPGLIGRVFVTALPCGTPLAASAKITLQLTVSYKRKLECCHFAIPISVEFLKYIPPPTPPQEPSVDDNIDNPSKI